MILHVGIDHERGQGIVNIFLRLIPDHAQNVETRENWVCKINVVIEVQLWFVHSSNGIGCSDHRASSLQGSNYTCLGNRNRLLLHCLVNTSPIRVVHLVKLINQADSFVSQYQSSSFEGPLPGYWVLVHTSCQPHSTGSLSRGVDHSMVNRFDVL